MFMFPTTFTQAFADVQLEMKREVKQEEGDLPKPKRFAKPVHSADYKPDPDVASLPFLKLVEEEAEEA